ncbi:MAG: M23 family metallopeptidase [Nonlabens sp.]|nr:M23 family metallopeptidase [Nonlabens sp.]
MKILKIIFLLIIILNHCSCKENEQAIVLENTTVSPEQYIPVTDGFDFPVGKPNAKGYYNAQRFGKNNHLGDDWNAVTGGNSDLGDPIYAIANGQVTFAEDIKGGWGNVIRIKHRLPDNRFVESLYAHCGAIHVKTGDIISKGHKIGTIGNAHGIYLAHLHFEIRNNIGMEIGPGYSVNTAGYLDPTVFINRHR